MRTYFILNEKRVKIAIVPPKSIRWSQNIYEPGSFSVEIPYEMYKELEGEAKYIYRDGGMYLGIIQKFDYSFTLSEGKRVILSGCFMEGLLNNIPCVMYHPSRQLEEVDGVILYDTEYPPPTGYSKKILKECQAVFFQGGEDQSERIREACYAAAQLFKHELDKYITAYSLPIKVFPFDALGSDIIKQEALDEIDAADEKGEFPSVELPSDAPEQYPDDGTDDQGRVYFKVKKGETVYLGDLLYSWLNGYWVKGSADGISVPPYHHRLVCFFDPETGEVTLRISVSEIAKTYELSEEKKNIASLSVVQDISQESAACVCSALYLEASKEDTPANYKSIKGKAIRNKFNDYYDLPLDGAESGKLEVRVDYLGNTFSDYINEEDCKATVINNLANYNNYNAPLTVKLTPLLEDVENYELYFKVGEFVKVEGNYMHIVAIDETVTNGVENLELTLSSSEKGAFKCFVDRTTSPFRDIAWKIGT